LKTLDRVAKLTWFSASSHWHVYKLATVY